MPKHLNLFILSTLLVFLSAGLLQHYYLFSKGYLPVKPSLLVSYFLNGFLICLTYSILCYSLKISRQFPLLIYFGVLFLKLGLYYLYFKPRFMLDNQLNDWEIWTFLTPLLLGLLLLIVGLHFYGTRSL